MGRMVTEDFHSGKDLYISFLQAFNWRYRTMTLAEVIHLCSRVCNEIDIKWCYVGSVKDMMMSKDYRGASDEVRVKRLEDLKSICIDNFPTFDPMWYNCINVYFERKSLVFSKNSENCFINLRRGQYSCALYSKVGHSNCLNEIQNFN